MEQHRVVCVAASHGQRFTQEEVARGIAQLSSLPRARGLRRGVRAQSGAQYGAQYGAPNGGGAISGHQGAVGG